MVFVAFTAKPKVCDTDFGVTVLSVERDCATVLDVDGEPKWFARALSRQCFSPREQRRTDTNACEVFLDIEGRELNRRTSCLWAGLARSNHCTADKACVDFGNEDDHGRAGEQSRKPLRCELGQHIARNRGRNAVRGIRVQPDLNGQGGEFLCVCRCTFSDERFKTHNVGREWAATAHSALKNGGHAGRRCGSIRRTRWTKPLRGVGLQSVNS
jgi:hypothetical protein